MYDLQTILLDLQQQPARTVFIDDHQQISAKILLTDVVNLAEKMAMHEATRWALCYQHSYYFLVALLATLACRRQPILLPNNKSGTLNNFVEHYDAVLSDLDDLEATPLNSRLETFVVEELSAEQVITLFTSGSTGEPKKIQRSLQQLFAEISVLEAVFRDDMSDSVVYSTVSHQHIYGLLFYILWPLFAKRNIIYPLLVYPENIINVFSVEQNVCLISSPALLKRIFVNRAIINHAVIFSSGGLLENVAAKNIEQAFSLYPYEVLGSTETSGVAYRQQLKSTHWQCLPGVNIDLEPVTQCLRVASPFFAGDDAFVMGDSARLLTEGCFELLPRQDRIVKIEGKRVSLVEMETTLQKNPEIQQAYVLALENKRQYLAAVIELTPCGQRLLEQQGKRLLNNYLTGTLTPYFERLLLPKKYRYMTKIPTNSQGKMVLSELQGLFE